MKKICIACDTTSTFSLEEAKENRIELIPLSVIENGKEYKDLIDISKEDLRDMLNEKKMPTTSQPSIGYAQSLLESWKEYDEILILTLTSSLSGTYQCLKLAASDLGMNNVHIIDTRTLATPIKDAALCARKMADEGIDIADIIKELDRKLKNTQSYLFPATLEQLKRGGRITPLAANMANTLKLKPLLSLQDNGSKIDKYAITRTEKKAWQLVMEAFDEQGINENTHIIYVVHSDNLEKAEEVKNIMKNHYPKMDVFITDIPAVLTCHAGLGLIAVQSVCK